MAVFELGRGRIARHTNALPRAGAPYRRHGARQQAVLELVGTCLVLVGIGVGILTLRFVLLLMHDVLN